MRFAFEPLAAEFLARPNRFVVVARLQQTREVVRAHCADPGRMEDLLVPGRTVILYKSSKDRRKTAYDLRLVVHPANGQLVSVNSQLPNRLFEEAVRHDRIEPLRGFRVIRKEVSVPTSHEHGETVTSRIDFLLANGAKERIWVEVKSVTLVKDRVALFPDAPTTRGRRHLMELARLIQQSDHRGAVVFVVQRADAVIFCPNRAIDPAFADALLQTAGQGVEVYACTAEVGLQEIRIDKRIPVDLSATD